MNWKTAPGKITIQRLVNLKGLPGKSYYHNWPEGKRRCMHSVRLPARYF